MNDLTVDNEFVCNICDKNFDTNYLLKLHERNHTEEAPFKCTICEKTFKFARSFKIHQDFHNKSAKCEICDLVLSKSLVKRHQKEFHYDVIKKYECGTCAKPYFNERSMMQHQLTHAVQKPFQCKTCEKSYSFRSGLRFHEKFHHSHTIKQLNYKCEVCTKWWKFLWSVVKLEIP